MRVGRIARIRVNPKDCVAIVDVLQKLEINTPGISFSQGVSIALSSAMEAFRQNGVIPVRDEFDYTKLMQRFPEDRPADRARKLEVTSAIGLRGAPALVGETPDRKRRRLRYEELRFKKKSDSLNWTDEEQQELVPLVEEFFVP